MNIKTSKEKWKPVVGYEGLYEVSNLGNVKSIERTVVCKNGRKHHVKEKIFKVRKDTLGYIAVSLCKNGMKKDYRVHRLVAEAFIPNPNNLPCINHKDENKTNNVVSNLEWCTLEYNLTYGTAQERRATHTDYKAISEKLTNHPDKSKTVYQYTTANELVKEWCSTAEVWRQTGFNRSNISQCCKGKRNTAHGYKWSYTPLIL